MSSDWDDEAWAAEQRRLMRDKPVDENAEKTLSELFCQTYGAPPDHCWGPNENPKCQPLPGDSACERCGMLGGIHADHWCEYPDDDGSMRGCG